MRDLHTKPINLSKHWLVNNKQKTEELGANTMVMRIKAHKSYPEFPSGELDKTNRQKIFCRENEWFNALQEEFGKFEGKNKQGSYEFFKVDEDFGPQTTVVEIIERG